MTLSKKATAAARELKTARENLSRAKRNKASSEELKKLEKIVADKAYVHSYIINHNM